MTPSPACDSHRSLLRTPASTPVAAARCLILGCSTALLTAAFTFAQQPMGTQQNAGDAAEEKIDATLFEGFGQGFQAAPQERIEPPTMTEHDPANEVTLEGGVRIVDLEVGRGPAVAEEAMLGVEYSGWLASGGTLFDTTRPMPDRGARGTVFTPYNDRLLDGWIEGLKGMREGGKRKIMIPAAMGFGANPTGSVPANADLIYEVELVEVTPRPEVDAQRATKTEDGGYWRRLKAGSGQTFQEDGFLSAHVVLWNEEGKWMGTSKTRTEPMTVQWNSGIFWGPYTRGMQAGEHRAVMLPNPRGAVQTQRADGSTVENADPESAGHWTLVVAAYEVYAPVKAPKFDRAKGRDIGEGVLAIDLKTGNGEELPKNAIPIVKFAGWVVTEDGLRLFDTTEQPGRDELFASPGLVIRGLELGLKGMRLGDRRMLYIPAELGHGDAGFAQQRIPPGADLVYEVEVVRYEMPLFLFGEEGEGGEGGGGFNLFGGEGEGGGGN